MGKRRLLGSVAIAGFLACSSDGSGGGGGTGGSGGVAPDASLDDAGADAEVGADAASEPVLFEDTCTFNESLLLTPGRTLTELAFAHPFVRIVGGDSATCCFQGLGPTSIGDGSVAVGECVPIGGSSIAGNRVVTWHIPKVPVLETFQAPCSATYYVGSEERTFAEQAFPGKSMTELSAVRAIVHRDTPLFVYTWDDIDTEYFDQRPGQMFLRDGSLAVACSPGDSVTFVVPSVSASPSAEDVACDADENVAELEYPGATLEFLAAVRTIRHGIGESSVGTAPGSGELYQTDIAEERMTLADDPTPLVSVDCLGAYTSVPITGPITFVSW
jgi:hypothetical protein